MKDIEVVVDEFSKGILPKEEWTHEAHVVVAFWHNWHLEEDLAFQQVKNKIIAYNEAVGTANTDDSGYHETLTRFWMLLSRNFIEKNTFSNVEEACARFLNSGQNLRTIPFEYYSKDVLFSVKARREYVPGDKKLI